MSLSKWNIPRTVDNVSGEFTINSNEMWLFELHISRPWKTRNMRAADRGKTSDIHVCWSNSLNPICLIFSDNCEHNYTFCSFLLFLSIILLSSLFLQSSHSCAVFSFPLFRFDCRLAPLYSTNERKFQTIKLITLNYESSVNVHPK